MGAGGGNEGANCRDQDSAFRFTYIICVYIYIMMCIIYYFTGCREGAVLVV